MNVPRDPVFFTTWAWWTVLVAVLLHLARATPAAIAGGLFPSPSSSPSPGRAWP